MNSNYSGLLLCVLGMVLVSTGRCHSQQSNKPQLPTSSALEKEMPIDEYVVEILEDHRGQLWFGTLSKGAARWDGKQLRYFTTDDGLIGNSVVSMVEDKNGHLWMGTHSGLSRFDGLTFTNYSEADGLPDFRVSELLIDRSGLLWIGTWGGVSTFDGEVFTSFPLPIPDIKLESYQTTMDWVTDLMEDSNGHIWITRDGYGACRWDGKQFHHFTKTDGLPSNNVQEIIEDQQGNIWFGFRATENDHPDPEQRRGSSGLAMYDGHRIARFPETEGLTTNDIYAVHEDSNGRLWIGVNRVGLYMHDGKQFKLYNQTDGSHLMPFGFGIQSILEDRKGRIWLGLSGGLFKLQDPVIMNVTQNGPW